MVENMDAYFPKGEGDYSFDCHLEKQDDELNYYWELDFLDFAPYYDSNYFIGEE